MTIFEFLAVFAEDVLCFGVFNFLSLFSRGS